MASNRIGRINEEIQRELAALIRTVKDPRVHGLVSVTAVDTTPDLRYAKIYVSVFPFDRSTAVMAVLDKQNWLLRRSLGQRVHNQLKTVPEIQFFLDDSLEYIDNIDQLLREEK